MIAGVASIWPRQGSASSIAVLPFANMTGDAKNDVFSDGLTEEVIDSLTRVKDLRVAARTSAFAFKGKQVDIREVGQKLGVETVLEGSVRRMNDRLRITAQLNRVKDGYHLWSQTYDREVNDIFGIQEDVARAIVSKMQGRIPALASPTLWTQQHSSDPMVYSFYLQGRHYMSTYTSKGYESAIGYFEQAVAKDPGYAPAYVGLAQCHFLRGAAQLGLRRPDETVHMVRSLLTKALQIDSNLAEAHVVLGRLHAEYEWNFPEAKRELQRAIEIAPGAALPRMRYGVFLNFQGHQEEAINELKRAIESDPLASEPRVHLANAYYFSRRFDDAVQECRLTLRQNPRAWGAYLQMGLAEGGKGNYDAAVKAFENALAITGDKTMIGLVAAAGHAYGRAGKHAEARQSLQRVLDEYRSRPYTSPMFVARVYQGLGETDKVFEFLEKGYEYRDPNMLWLKCDPRFDSVRRDSRYISLMRRMNL